MKRFNALILPIAAAAALGSSVSAIAQDAPQAAVEYKMSELATQAGRDAVHQRLETAARHVCPVPGVRGLAVRLMQRDCIEQALASAETELAQRVAQAERDGRIQLADSRR
jgi:UrcA family protein